MQNGKAVWAQPAICFMSFSTSTFTKSTHISESWHHHEKAVYSAQASEVLFTVCVRGKYSSLGQGACKPRTSGLAGQWPRLHFTVARVTLRSRAIIS